MSYQNLIEISKHLEEFESEYINNSFDIEHFAYWLTEKVTKKPRSFHEQSLNTSDPIIQQSPDVQISILIGRMGKYARVYTKKIFLANEMTGMDDFSFMATLMFRESLTKSELINYNLMDSATSGSDIIKRLIKQEWMEEYDDQTDHRSKRVRLTSLGKNKMFKVFNEMDAVASVVSGNLDQNEKLYLLKYLKKLDCFHKEIYDTDRKMEIQAIKKKYVG